MWTLLFLVLAFRPAALSLIPSPTNVTFVSVNLRNILQWSPAHNSPVHTTYTVQYAIYGDSVEKRLHFRPVQHCTEISSNWCDLSVWTSDLEHSYYAKVRAVSRKGHSKWVWTERFSPKHNTEFGPPHVSVEIEDNNMIITIEGPMIYLTHNHTPQVPMATVYSDMTYNLTVHNTRSGQIRHFPLTSKQFKYLMIDHGTEYCFSAKTKTLFMPNKHHSSAWHCITTPQDSLIDQLQRIVVGIVVPVVLLGLLVAGGYSLYKYLSGKDQKSPYILSPPTFFPPPFITNLDLIVFSVPKQEVPSDFGKNKVQSYPALQRPETSQLCELSRKNSVDYGLVTKNDGRTENAEEVNVEKCNVHEEKKSYKSKEWQIKAESSGGSYASQNSFLQASSNQMLLNPLEENCHGLSLHENPETGSLQLQFDNGNESSIVVEGQNVENGTSYVSQRGCLGDLPDDYGVLGVAAEEEVEDVETLQINWDPATKKLIIPGLDLGLGQSGEESLLRNVFVRQASEEDALLGASGQQDAEEFKTKWGLVVSND